VQILQYDEFGNRTVFSNTGEIPTEAQPFGFAGGLFDADTGLVRFGARDYEPQTGRWLAKDPALFGGAQTNFYVYVGNDPINKVDPGGRSGLIAGFSADFGAISQGDFSTGYIDGGDYTFNSTSFNVGPGGSTGVGGQIGYLSGSAADFVDSKVVHLGFELVGVNVYLHDGSFLGLTVSGGLGYDLGLLWTGSSRTSVRPTTSLLPALPRATPWSGVCY
jgi:RHS repeat-associated protein